MLRQPLLARTTRASKRRAESDPAVNRDKVPKGLPSPNFDKYNGTETPIPFDEWVYNLKTFFRGSNIPRETSKVCIAQLQPFGRSRCAICA